jgi:hypothetical protein
VRCNDIPDECNIDVGIYLIGGPYLSSVEGAYTPFQKAAASFAKDVRFLSPIWLEAMRMNMVVTHQLVIHGARAWWMHPVLDYRLSVVLKFWMYSLRYKEAREGLVDLEKSYWALLNSSFILDDFESKVMLQIPSIYSCII